MDYNDDMEMVMLGLDPDKERAKARTRLQLTTGEPATDPHLETTLYWRRVVSKERYGLPAYTRFIFPLVEKVWKKWAHGL